MTTTSDDAPNPRTIRLFEHKGSTSSFLDVEIKSDGSLEMSGYDIGEMPERFYGHDDYEYEVTVKPEHKDRLLLALLQEKYDNNFRASSQFMEFLNSRGIPYDFDTWP